MGSVFVGVSFVGVVRIGVVAVVAVVDGAGRPLATLATLARRTRAESQFDGCWYAAAT